MKILFFVLAIFVSMLSYGQVDFINPNIIPEKIDSVHLSLWDIYTKEVSISEAESEYEKEIKKVKLTESEISVFRENILSDSSYDHSRALLTHYNLVFDVFEKDKMVATVQISTLTGNIDIENRANNSAFSNNCSEILGKYLIQLMSKYKLLEMIDESDLIGVNMNK